MKRKGKRIFAAALAAALLLTGGCSVKGTELSRRLIVEAIGLDLTAQGVRVTLEALDAHTAGGGEKTEGGDETKLLRFEGATVGQALSQIAPQTGLSPLLSQARVLVLGRALAETDLTDALDVFLRQYNVRSDILLCMAEGEAETVVTAGFGKGVPGARVLEEAIQEGQSAGVCVAAALYEFINRSRTKTDAAYCPVIAVRDDAYGEAKTPVFSGTAVFSGGRLAFTADERLTQGMLFLMNKIKNAALTVNGAAGAYTLQTVSSKTRIVPEKTENGKVHFYIGIRTVCDIAEFTPAAPGAQSSAADAQTAGKAYIEALAAQSLQTLFFERHADICRFARRINLRYPALREQYIRTMFEETEVHVQAALTVRRTGKEEP